MKQRASWLNVLVNVEIITIPLVSFMLLGLCQLFNISIWYATSMLVLSIIDIAFDWHTMRISPKLLGTASILELRKKLVRQKKERMWQTCISAPIFILWTILFIYAMFSDSNSMNLAGATVGIIGGTAGAVSMIVIYGKAQGTNDSMLNDIEEIDSE